MHTRYINCLLLILGVFLCVHPQKTDDHLRRLSITTEPNASVWLNDVFYGITDPDGKLEIRSIPAGIVRARVRSDGFAESRVNVPATARGNFAIKLTKTTDKAELAFQEAERKLKIDRREAIDAYKKTLEIKPAYPDVLIALARALIAIGEFTEAEDAIAKARKLRPSFAEASAVEGRLYKDEGDETKAIASFERAIKEGRGFQPEAFTGLGLLYSDKADAAADDPSINDQELFALAETNFTSAIKQLGSAPDAAVVYQLLGRIYEKRGENDQAIALYKTFLKLFPDSPESTAVRSFITQLEKQP